MSRETIMDPTLPVWHPDKFKPVERRHRRSATLLIRGKRAKDVQARTHIFLAGLAACGLTLLVVFSIHMLR